MNVEAAQMQRYLRAKRWSVYGRCCLPVDVYLNRILLQTITRVILQS